ncbi:heme oxygenase (biliverdin-producing) [Amycolatopsis sp. NPDC102389]|uniref:biliverdin-producing heme oxygenase n=1 Tax=Amycolatopsis sp. NPDC102389 TaxID=3363941 RepID=UPI0037F4D54E
MPVTTDVESGPFSATLRASTLPAHERANHSEYMNALLGGELSLEGYTRLAIQYYFIYQAIEQAADKLANDPVAGKFVFEELRRLPSLERDLEHLVGPDWRETVRPLPSTERYARRVAEASDWSGGFVAHHYTRYLGDIAGGQVIRRLLERKYDVREEGSLFYHFDQLGSAPKFRDNYREQLNSAPWTEDERARLIEEAIVAFECNIAVFDELAAELDAYRAA